MLLSLYVLCVRCFGVIVSVLSVFFYVFLCFPKYSSLFFVFSEFLLGGVLPLGVQLKLPEPLTDSHAFGLSGRHVTVEGRNIGAPMSCPRKSRKTTGNTNKPRKILENV